METFMIRTRVGWIGPLSLAIIGAALALYFGGGSAGAVDSGPACYDNQWVYSDGGYLNGAASASGRGTGTFTESELEFGTAPEIDNGGGTATWDFKGAISGPNNANRFGPQSPGNITGGLTILVKWANGTVTTFNSRCAAEVQTDASGGGSIEMEFEGTVQGFPRRPGERDAVASIKSERQEDGSIKSTFSIELGTTCFEGYPDSEKEIGFAAVSTGALLKADAKDVGRWSFPDGHGPGNCEGAF